ncbi:MAG TPA: penicillin-binding protein [Candidatus Eubacterium pullicola]|nr:penicillin-binding protein [Candidatus Eubacterium pullicola]
MKKMQKRAIICLFFAVLLVAGTAFYIGKLAINGGDWVSYPANQHIYTNNKITTGVILDRNGDTLISNSKDGETQYNSDTSTREALVHVTGDSLGNIATGANVVFKDKMVGYNFITGVYSASGEGRTINLTVDANISKVAGEALGNRSGTVGVYNYETGEIICMVSSPNYDPYDPPQLDADDTSGTYLNRFTSSSIVPGSTFKVITSMAAIETVSDLDDWTYTCTGSEQYGSYSGDRITCLYPHGTVNFEEALAESCNCAFGELANKVGAENLKKYTEMAGLTSSYDINGINTRPGSFEFSDNDLDLAWTGIGQSKDLVNPCSMMVFMGAIANGGKSAEPYIIDRVRFANGLPASFPIKHKTETLINEDTAAKLTEMLKNNVESNYGTYNFPGLDIAAKSGTAEHGEGTTPHAWFTGFLDDPDHPYAFVVVVENGGYGTETAGSVANEVLQAIVKQDDN